jgi:hypothetical protein
MNPDDAIRTLREIPRIVSVVHKSTFEIVRLGKDGNALPLIVELYDYGAEMQARYMCVATAQDGRHSSGHPMPTMKGAVNVVAWGDFDG